jgi:hypothetical protein
MIYMKRIRWFFSILVMFLYENGEKAEMKPPTVHMCIDMKLEDLYS